MRLPTLRDRSRVVPRSDSACVFTKRERSENAGFTKSRRVIGEHVSHPLVGWRTSDQDGWGLRSNLICRGIFEDFHAGSKGNLYSKIATPRRPAPVFRIRPNDKVSALSSSSQPTRIVSRHKPVSRETTDIPPRPIARASAPATKERARNNLSNL